LFSQHFYQLADRGLLPHATEEIQMQTAHLYEAIVLVNRGVDEAVRGLERLKRAKDSQLNPSCFEEELALFEDHRARVNSYFCSTIQRAGQFLFLQHHPARGAAGLRPV
jgi:hypothetical protein